MSDIECYVAANPEKTVGSCRDDKFTPRRSGILVLAKICVCMAPIPSSISQDTTL